MLRRHAIVGWVVVAAVGLLAAAAGCRSEKAGGPWASAGSRPKVLVSFPPLYSFAASVAGEDAYVRCLLTTTGPHTHGDATADQIELYRGCDLFVINGLGLEDEGDGILPKLRKAAGDKPILNLGSKLDESWLREGECHHDHTKPDEPHEHGIDPHVWLSTRCARRMVEAIRDELKRIDPAHAEGYDQRAADYIARLNRLEADGKAMMAPKENKWILPFHESLGYFAETFGLKTTTAIQVDPGKEPTAEKLQKIIDTCRKRRVRVIAVEPQFSNHTSARVIRDALRGLKTDPIEAEFVEVDPLETCDEGQLSPNLYENVMRRNLSALAQALR